MSEQRQTESQEAVFGDFASLLESLGSEFWETLERLPIGEASTVDQGPVPELILACSPLGDQVDGQIRCLSTALNGQTFAVLLSEALSNAEQTILLYRSLEQLALQLPKIGIAELLVSSPLFPTSALDPTSISGMIATQSKACAAAEYLHPTEEKRMKEESLLQEKQCQDLHLCEASPPKKRGKKE